MNRIGSNNAIGKNPDWYYTDTTQFNGPCYYQVHPDLASDPVFSINPALHYMLYGAAAGYDQTGPCPVGTDPTGTGSGTAASGTPAATSSLFSGTNLLLIAGAAAILLFHKKIFGK